MPREGFFSLLDETCFEIPGVVDAFDRLRRWAGLPPGIGGRRPPEKLLDLLYGHGRAEAERVLHQFVEEQSDPTDPAIAATIRAVAHVAVRAHPRWIDWTLSGYWPQLASPTGKRLVVHVSAEVGERVRVAAFNTRSTTSDLLRSALLRELDRIEKAKPAETKPRKRRRVRARRARARATTPAPAIGEQTAPAEAAPAEAAAATASA